MFEMKFQVPDPASGNCGRYACEADAPEPDAVACGLGACRMGGTKDDAALGGDLTGADLGAGDRFDCSRRCATVE